MRQHTPQRLSGRLSAPPVWLILCLAGSFVFLVLLAGQLLGGVSSPRPLGMVTATLVPSPSSIATARPTPLPTADQTPLPSGAIALPEAVQTAAFDLRPNPQTTGSALHLVAGTLVLTTGDRQAERCRVNVLASHATIWLDCAALEVQP